MWCDVMWCDVLWCDVTRYGRRNTVHPISVEKATRKQQRPIIFGGSWGSCGWFLTSFDYFPKQNRKTYYVLEHLKFNLAQCIFTFPKFTNMECTSLSSLNRIISSGLPNLQVVALAWRTPQKLLVVSGNVDRWSFLGHKQKTSTPSGMVSPWKIWLQH